MPANDYELGLYAPAVSTPAVLLKLTTVTGEAVIHPSPAFLARQYTDRLRQLVSVQGPPQLLI